MSRAPINCASWVRCFSNGEHKLVHALHHGRGQVLLGIIPLLGQKEKPELIHRFDLDLNQNFSPDEEFLVESLDGVQVLKKIDTSQSKDGLRMRYVISEFKMETDFFTKISPDDKSKLVRETQLTFYNDNGNQQIELKSWKLGKGRKDHKTFLKLDDITSVDWILKFKVEELKEAKEEAKKLFLEFRNEMWGITDGKLRGIHEEFEETSKKQKLDVVAPAVDDQAALESKEAQVIGERYMRLSFIYYSGFLFSVVSLLLRLTHRDIAKRRWIRKQK